MARTPALPLSLLTMLPVALLGCATATPYPVPIQLTPERLMLDLDAATEELDPARYDRPPPFNSFQIENVGGSMLFVTPAAPQGDRPDLLNVKVAPFTQVLPGQRILVEVEMEDRTFLWETGEYEATMKLEGSYFFSGQALDEPETPSLRNPPSRQAIIYDLFVEFAIDCDLDGDGYDAKECAGPDCDDRSASINPDALESCDGVDEDCDGAVDEDAPDRTTWYYDDDDDNYGDPNRTRESCQAPGVDWVDVGDDCDDTSVIVSPGGFESCDGVDNDCDGEIDEGC